MEIDQAPHRSVLSTEDDVPGRMSLVAFLVRVGRSVGEGHYVAYSLHGNTTFTKFDDAQVSSVSRAVFEKEAERAYVLVYERVGESVGKSKVRIGSATDSSQAQAVNHKEAQVIDVDCEEDNEITFIDVPLRNHCVCSCIHASWLPALLSPVEKKKPQAAQFTDAVATPSRDSCDVKADVREAQPMTPQLTAKTERPNKTAAKPAAKPAAPTTTKPDHCESFRTRLRAAGRTSVVSH